MQIVEMLQLHVLRLLRPITTPLLHFRIVTTSLYSKTPTKLGKSRGKKRGKLIRTRKTRGMLADKQKGPKSFAVMLEEAELDQLPPEVPSYLTAAVGPSKTASTRKWCSVCGNFSPYTCPRCGSAFCSKKCYPVHIETRCLKFVT
ncbi:hypothetical protein ABBQ32_003850 [Trebouxia sp. C0010 RCD-2024]